MGAFEYPPATEERRHGPQGYSDYSSYRPWLRDEFSFRCVYCLIREQWGRVKAEFDLDHFVAQAREASLALNYGNLLYACHTCNVTKGDRALPDPRTALTSRTVRVDPDGKLVGLTRDAKKIIRVLALDSDQFNRWRLDWIEIVETARDYKPQLYERLMGYPDDLPDLGRLRPPGGNRRPEGVEESFFARRARGELSATY